jgi:hypothetical protein
MGNINEHLMDSQYLRRGNRANLPAVGDAAKSPPGHWFVDWVDGTHFVNEGTPDKALYTGKGRHHSLIERFEKRPALNAVVALDETSNAAAYLAMNLANKDWEILGTNASTDDVTFADGGGIKLETDGADGDQVILAPHLDTNQSAWSAWKWNTNDELVAEAVIKTGADVSSAIVWFGFKLTNTPTTATDDNQAFFRFKAGAGAAIVCTASNDGVDDSNETTVATVAASTTYHLKIVVDSARVPRFYINGLLASTNDALKADVDLIPYLGVVSSGAAAAMSVIVRFIRCGKTLND